MTKSKVHKVKRKTPKVNRCKNGEINTNIVKPGFRGFSGLRYSPTKGYRVEKGYDPQDIYKRKKSALEEMIKRD